MKAIVTSVVLKSLRFSSGQLRSIDRCGATAFQYQYSQRAEVSSASNWGVGEPRIDEKQTRRGASFSQATASGSGVHAGLRNDDKTSNFDPGVTDGQVDRKQPKKSRTGGDMSDEGQVHTPSLERTPSTRDVFQNKGREVEERLKEKSD